MSYYATKDNITKVISKNMRKDYKDLGYIVTTDGNNPYDPYDYEDVSNNRLEPIVINGEVFTGYSSFYCINTKTYVTEPERTYDGSIPDINNYETFIVPRVKISFNYMTIHDFRRFLKATAPNEFPVTYYDYEIDKMVTYLMYIEPREMAKLYNIGYQVLAVTEQEISLIATLNDTDKLKITYYDNVTYRQVNPDYFGDNKDDYIKFDDKEMIFGNWYSIANGMNYSHNKSNTDNKTYKFLYWNTKVDGTGIKYLSNEPIQATQNMDLYAIWEAQA